MERKPSITMHWGLLLAVYWAILFASAMVALTSGINEGSFLLLLIAGIPIYFLSSTAIMRRHEEAGETATSSQVSNVLPFPSRSSEDTPADIAKVAAEARAPHLRKLG